MLTDRQQQVLDAFVRLGSQRAVARELGMHRRNVQQHLAAAAKKGFSPALAPVAEGRRKVVMATSNSILSCSAGCARSRATQASTSLPATVAGRSAGR